MVVSDMTWPDHSVVVFPGIAVVVHFAEIVVVAGEQLELVVAGVLLVDCSNFAAPIDANLPNRQQFWPIKWQKI